MKLKNNMKKILFILSLILFIGCGEVSNEPVQKKNNQPGIELIDTTCVQYDVHIGNNDVDVRVIPVTKNGVTHDYVVATAILYKAGGVSIEHWAGCNCLRIDNNGLQKGT